MHKAIEHPLLRLLRHEYEPASYQPQPYTSGAFTILAAHAVLTSTPGPATWSALCSTLRQLAQRGLDETDVYPFATLWILICARHLNADAVLLEELRAWRAWEEQDHLGQPLTFLPDLPITSPAPRRAARDTRPGTSRRAA